MSVFCERARLIIEEKREGPSYEYHQILLARHFVIHNPDMNQQFIEQMVDVLETPGIFTDEQLEAAQRDITHAWVRCTVPRHFEWEVLKEMAELSTLRVQSGIEKRRRDKLSRINS